MYYGSLRLSAYFLSTLQFCTNKIEDWARQNKIGASQKLIQGELRLGGILRTANSFELVAS
ncbi:MAG: hypothetical protein WAS56_04625 [Saprospiraceae bacterium]